MLAQIPALLNRNDKYFYKSILMYWLRNDLQFFTFSENSDTIFFYFLPYLISAPRQNKRKSNVISTNEGTNEGNGDGNNIINLDAIKDARHSFFLHVEVSDLLFIIFFIFTSSGFLRNYH